MGREVVKAVSAEEDLRLVGAFDVASIGADVGALAGVATCGVSVQTLNETTLGDARPDVLVDFTAASAAFDNARKAISLGISPVIGTTGMSDDEVALLRTSASDARVGAIYAPNFSIGAVLMMVLAGQAARFLKSAEIIELHHDGKRDAPSGTAKLTAERIADVWGEPVGSSEGGTMPARGESINGIQVHSVRLPGLVAHQEVIFGGTGQILTIRHDSLDRSSFMPGVLMAIRRVRQLVGLTVGLDSLLGLT